MLEKIKIIYVYITCLRFLPHWLCFNRVKNKDTIKEDFKRNIRQFVYRQSLQNNRVNTVGYFEFCYLLTYYKMTRNIYYARIKKNNKLLGEILALLAAPVPMLDISDTADIGGGLIVQHGYSTIIDPKSIGRNCWVNQNVTIGYTNETDCPTIGDNVTIYAGAKVLGNIRVGNNVIIAANAVVVKDVEDNCVVGGVPAKVIKRL